MAIILSQTTIFDYTEIEKLGDLERLYYAFAGIDDEELMIKLEKYRGSGRNDYPIRVMWNCLIAMKIFGHNTIESFRRELSRNVQLRKIVGLNDNDRKKHLVPPARVFTGFIKILEDKFESVNDIFNKTVEKLYALLPQFGKDLAGDGKYFDSYSKSPSKNEDNSDKRGEHDAKYSKKEYVYTDKNGRTQKKTETHYGFKGHIICDVSTELPIAFNMTTANVGEREQMIGLVDGLPKFLKVRATTISLDRGYDSKDLIKTIKDADIIPVVDIRNCWKDGEATRQYKDTDIVYDYCGNVYFCELKYNQESLIKMVYEGYDKKKKCLRYSHHGKIYKIYISYDERVFLPIARDSMKFKRLYKGRTSIERLNGRLDRDFMFEDHCIKGLGKMKTMLALSLLLMNGMAISKIKAGQTDKLAAFTRGFLKGIA